MLNKTTIADLQREIVRLREEADALESLLARYGLASDNGTIRSEHHGSNKTVDISEKSDTFSGIVRSALRAINRTATSGEVANWITKNVPDPRTSRPLRGAVSVELFRMAKKQTGGVRKTGRGRYRIGE